MRCRIVHPLLLGSVLACGDLLGIPGSPRLVQEEPLQPAPEQASPTGAVPDQLASGVTGTPEPQPAASGDGVLPAAGLGLSPTSPVVAEQPTAMPPEVPPAEDPAPVCTETTLPVDLILILDNSGSMAAETAAVERALIGWSQHMAALGLDYRLILLSRHRTGERSQSEAASTSICVEQPLSGLARCPSDTPVLGERFFHYSVKIDASDSFERALEGFASADAARLAPGGWSEWLRPGALEAFIEVSDADSDVPAAQFASRLGTLAPEHFAAGGGGPSFVFYSVVGLAEKVLPEDPYLPEEPIESAECRSADTSPDNAGEQYQTLSVLTGGLRFALCRVDALGARLDSIADDVLLKARRCVAATGGDG
jgi:hypothetical protein